MIPLKTVISSLIVATAFCIVPCSTFIHFKMYDNYFLLLPMSVGIGVVTLVAILACITNNKHLNFHFTIPDFLFTIIVVYYITRYDYQLQLANWKVLYVLLILLLWFAVRIILSNLTISKSILLGGFVSIGCILAIWGLLQLYGVQKSNNYLFPITGPFYNPGPYSGYLAMIFPISLSCLLQSVGKKRYIWFIAFSLILCILPAGMSRSAWLALFVSCIWLLSMRYNWISKLKRHIKTHPRRTIVCMCLLVCIFIILLFFLFQLKSDSANGRLFIWKNTCKAMCSHPLFGHGIGSFPYIYGKIQSDYFKSGNYTELDEKVAGSPEYAFNEYLQISIEGGVILLLLFLSLTIWGIRNGVRNKEYAACSGLISLLIFSLSSYPFQILPFLITGVLLFAICVSKTDKPQSSKNRHLETILLLVIILVGETIMGSSISQIPEASKRWERICSLYEHGSFKEASLECRDLYKHQKHNSNYLIKYAQCLMKQEKYEEACEILERAKQVSCHPFIWNLQGQYYQYAQNYVMAEKCFKEAINLLPGRIYPYYLLAKLYFEPSFFQEAQIKKMAKIVLSKKPKIPSKAIDEMRMEIRILLAQLPRSNM